MFKTRPVIVFTLNDHYNSSVSKHEHMSRNET